MFKEISKKSFSNFLNNYFSDPERNIIETLIVQRNNELFEMFQVN
jgi:hypothetical protein